MMDDTLRRQADDVFKAYDAETQWWDDVPEWAKSSRHRLEAFMERDLDLVVGNEITILRRQIIRMKQIRLGCALAARSR